MQKKSVIVNYSVGNINSIQKTCQFLGVKTDISQDIKTIQDADLLILPGQGAFKSAKQTLDTYKLTEPIKSHILNQKPLLAICIGFQLLFDSSDEAPSETGFGLLKGGFKAFQASSKFPVPHMGWNTVDLPASLKSKCPDNLFYFVHSYYTNSCPHDFFISETCYQNSFVSLLYKPNFLATQFHPEKSGKTGLALLDTFFKTLQY